MTTTVDIEQVPIDVSDDLTRAREVVAQARNDKHTALVAHTRLLTIEVLTSQIAQVEAEVARERQEWADWMHTAIEHSREVANEHDWCGVYDATMERLGFPPRGPEQTDVGWRCTVTLSTDVDDDDVRRLVREQVSGTDSIEVTTSAEVSVEVTVRGEVTADEGSCVCGSVDSDDIRVNLPSWASDWEIDEEGTVYCDND